MLFGVFFLQWRVSEVLLLFWVETVWVVLLVPISAALQGGKAAAIRSAGTTFHHGLFLAFHAFFLTGLLYGVEWDQVVGGPAGWSAPAKGQPWHWFAAAWNDMPWLGVLCIVGFGIADLFRNLPTLRLAGKRDFAGTETLSVDSNEAVATGHVVIMHVGIIFGGSAILAAGGDWGMLVAIITLKAAYEIVMAIRRSSAE